MHFSFRFGRPADIPACLNLLDRSAFAAPECNATLSKMFTQLPLDERLIFVVVEEKAGSGKIISGFAASIYLHDSYLDHLRTTISCRLWTRLVKDWRNGCAEILTRREIGIANHSGGLCGFSPFHICDSSIKEPDQARYDVRTRRYFACIIEAFLEMHRGNWHRRFCKEIMRNQLSLNQRNGYSRTQELSHNLQLIEVVAGQSEVEVGGWLAPIFDYHPPRIGFTDSERRLLQVSLQGQSIRESALALEIPEATVKQQRQTLTVRAMAFDADLNRFSKVVKHVVGSREELRPYVMQPG